MKKPSSQREQDSGDAIRRGDHLFATDGVEQMSENYRTEYVSQRERQQITTNALFGHRVKPHQDERVSKKDRVVKKRLRQHQDESENGTMSMFVYDRVPDFSPRGVRSSLDPCRRGIMRRQRFRIGHNSALDFIHDRFRLGISP